jgi:VanZ family protein
MIFKFSSGNIPSASDNFWLDFIIKKIGHIILFATLAVLIYRALIGEGVSRKKAAIYAVVTSFLYGVGDEFHQMFTQGREAKFRDTLIDGVGASLAMFLIYRFISILPKSVREMLAEIGIK